MKIKALAPCQVEKIKKKKLIQKTPRKTQFRSRENPIPVLEYAPGFPTYVVRNGKVPFGQRGGQLLYTTPMSPPVCSTCMGR